jgi:hypothetical protein
MAEMGTDHGDHDLPKNVVCPLFFPSNYPNRARLSSNSEPTKTKPANGPVVS